MIFNRAVPALLAAAVSAQALYIPDALHAREFEESNEIAARGLEHLNVVRDLASNDDVMVLTARDFAELGLRSEDVLSQILVTRTPPSRTPSPGPYECKNKADCQKHIDHAHYQMTEAKTFVDKWQGRKDAAKKGTPEHRNAGNNLHTAKESHASWKDNHEYYSNLKGTFASRDLAELGLRSEDALSEMLVTRTPPSRTPSPGPYQCNNKADCQKHIDHAHYQMTEAKTFVDKWQARKDAARKGTPEHRNAGNNLHTAKESHASWKDNHEYYTNLKGTFSSR